MEDYATSQVADRLPHLWYIIIYALEASLVHRRHLIQREALQIDLRRLDWLVSQQFADHLDRYTLFLQGRAKEWRIEYEVTISVTPQAFASSFKELLKSAKAEVYSRKASSPVFVPLKKVNR